MWKLASHFRAAKVRSSLRNHTVSPAVLLFAYTKNVLSNIRPVSSQDSPGVILRVCDTYQNFASCREIYNLSCPKSHYNYLVKSILLYSDLL